jgi:glutamate dehydrogenase
VQRYNGVSADYHLALGQTDAAQIHFTIWVEGEDIPEVPFHQLEAEVVAMTRSWTDRLISELGSRVPAGDAHRLAETWGPRFPEYYSASTSIEIAAGDVLMLDALERIDRPALVGIQNETEREQIDRLTRITLYRKEGKRPLNELMPALVDLGLEVVEEVPTRLSGGGDFFIHDFGVLGPGHLLVDIDDTAERLRRALDSVWSGGSDSDDLNRLLIVGGLSLDQIEILRAYRTYWRRVLPVFTVAYVNNTLVGHVDICVKLVALFESRFHPSADGAAFDTIRETSWSTWTGCLRWKRTASCDPSSGSSRRPSAPTPTARTGRRWRSRCVRPTFPMCRCRCRCSRCSWCPQPWRASTFEPAWSPAVGSAGRPGGRTIAPRCSV